MVQMTDITGGWTEYHRMRLGRIINVSRPVCSYCTNNTSDVMLVQVLLNKACGDAPVGGPFAWSQALPRLRPDGVFGTKTKDWIVGLQSDPVYGMGLHEDGRIDPATATLRASLTDTVYTIYILNVFCHQRDRSFLANLHTDHSVPAYLRRHISGAIAGAGV